jgi:Flp pilus assembly protein TadD
MSGIRAAGLVAFVAVAAYANSLGNGFAYDDNEIVSRNPIVNAGAPAQAFLHPYWPRFAPGSGLYRPVSVATFTAEWSLWGDRAALFHLTNVVLHATVSVLVVGLLLGFVGIGPAALGGGLFAIHPVHTEAVANVVGRSELLAGLFVLMACLLYERVRSEDTWHRVLRLLGIGLCYLLALGSKEIAVSLPALLLLLELFRRDRRPFARRVWDQFPVFGVLMCALVAYLFARVIVLGSLLGELPAPELRSLSTGARLLTAVSLWPEYLRLMLWPFDLSADYSPAVFTTTTSVNAGVIAGGLALLGLTAGVLIGWSRAALVALGVLWFAVSVSPVSQVLFPTGVLLAERTLYLPSVGVALVAGGVAALMPGLTVRVRRLAYATAMAFACALFLKTVDRNPSWMSTYTVLQTLAADHPESSLALRTRGAGLVRAGEVEGAFEAYEAAVALAPSNYGILTEVGHFYGEQRRWSRGEELLRAAIVVASDRPAAYRLLARQWIQQERYREAHHMAIRGLAAAGPDRELWALVSETYVAKGDFAAAIRARRAALAQDPRSSEDWSRLAELHELNGDPAAARHARAQAARVASGANA